MALTVDVDKEQLLGIIQENRARHRAVFEAAIEGYRREAERLLAEKLTALQAGRMPVMYIGLAAPEDHTRDYDRVIRMIGMHEDRVLRDLPEDVFAMYVEDDWRWKRQFVSTARSYAPGVTSANYGDGDGE